MLKAVILGLAVTIGVSLFFLDSVHAGMPSLLPSNWTADRTPDWADRADRESSEISSSVALRLQAISFFVVLFAGCSWLVKILWNVARRDFPQLPRLSFLRSLGLVFLWGLAFSIVLTMISGARELMTPGAWKKQGWTYTLADSSPSHIDEPALRRRQLEELRTVLWQFAATHSGQLPDLAETEMDSELWKIEGWPGLTFLAVSGLSADDSGRLYVFEPEIDGEERLVLLTNGMIGSMSSAAIRAALNDETTRSEPSEETSEDHSETQAPADDTMVEQGVTP